MLSNKALASMTSFVLPVAFAAFVSQKFGWILDLVLKRVASPSTVIRHQIGIVPSDFCLSLHR